MQRMIFFILILFLPIFAMAEDCRETGKQKPSNWKFLGKEFVVVYGKIIELNVFKNEHDVDKKSGERIKFIKRNEDNSVFIDSTIYSDGTTSILETDDFPAEGIYIDREKSRNEIDSYEIRKDEKIIEWYDIGLKKDDLYDFNGKLSPEYREVRGDTAFRNLDYIPPYTGCSFQIIEVDDKKELEETKAKRKKK